MSTLNRWDDDRLDKLATTVEQIAVQVDNSTQNFTLLSARVNTLSEKVDTLSTKVDHMSDKVDQVSDRVDKLTDDVDKLREESKESGIRFDAYQKATQWVVNLAFGLIASATVTVIITTVLRR